MFLTILQKSARILAYGINPVGYETFGRRLLTHNFWGRRLCSSAAYPQSCLLPQKTAVVTIPQHDKLYHRIELEVRGHDPAVLKSYEQFALTAGQELELHVGHTWGLGRKPYKLERYTLLKSKFIFKKHRVQYEIRTYYRFIEIKNITGSTADTFLEYIERNLPEGVGMKVTKLEIQRLSDVLNPAS